MSGSLSFGLRHDYVIMSKQAPSWIRHVGFQKFFQILRKPPKILKTNKMMQKKYLKGENN